jgi:hypothetical protein
MFKTKFDGNELEVLIDEAVQKELFSKGISPIEVCRLVESFASKMLTSKKDEVLQISNEDTGASLALAVTWESEKKVSVRVSIVNLDNLTVEEKPKSKVNLVDPSDAANQAFKPLGTSEA